MAKGFHPIQHPSDPVRPSSCETNNNTSREPNMNSNRSGLTLPLNQMAIPIYTVPMTEEEVRAGGHVLLHGFIHEEFEQEGMSDDVLLANPPPDAAGDAVPQMYQSPVFGNHTTAASGLASTPGGYTPPSLIHVGSNIRELANQFAASKQRREIRQQADQVDLGHINPESFFDLLNEIFKNGIDKHCIVALFFFCSDILKRCVRQQLNELGSQLFWWSMRYVADSVCRWVYKHGGWERVFSNLYNVVIKVGAIVALGVIISCGFVWMRKNW